MDSPPRSTSSLPLGHCIRGKYHHPDMGAGHLSFDLDMMISRPINQNQNPKFFIKRQGKFGVLGVRILVNGCLEIITFAEGWDPSFKKGIWDTCINRHIYKPLREGLIQMAISHIDHL